ncbi:MAG: glycosyltransferase family 2 protein, partial [Planctomycetes bacterium]|nr:glycosyltransferase family 2 protein [Planctomycetota bacterium]
MKLALVSPLPPVPGVAADLCDRLLPALQRRADLVLLPHGPEAVDARFAQSHRVEPCAALPGLLAAGTIEVPVYLVADALEHAHQIRFVREHPGVLVLLSAGVHRVLACLTEESADLPAYRALLVEEHGAVAAEWPERYLWRADRVRVQARLPLTGVLCRRSHVVLAPAAIAARLRARHPDLAIIDLPEDPEAAASAIIAAARQTRSAPRAIAPLPQPRWPSVEVVVVGYNCRRIIEPAVRSIAAQDYPNLRCTLVDNASADGTGDYVRTHFPEVRVLTPPRNLGFAGGNNFAFDRTEADYVVLFNQDAVARPDFVRELVRVAERDPKVAAVGAKMLLMRCPTIFNSTGILMNEAGFAVDRQIGEKDLDPSPVPVRVFGACGGAKLIRTAALRELGGFDDTFFMYFEDVDLCWRMRLAGREILYAPLAVVHHDWHGDLDADDRPTLSEDEVNAKTHRRRFLCERNRLQCLFKNYAWPSLRGVLPALRGYDRVRLGWVRDAIRGGREVGYFTMVGKAIRGAWRWNLWRMPSLLRRRKAVQRLRKLPDAALAELIERGIDEPSYIGDLEVIQDRFSAHGVARLQMGVNERRSLGPGWYGVEPVAGEPWDLRWSKARAWFYLSAAAPA